MLLLLVGSVISVKDVLVWGFDCLKAIKTIWSAAKTAFKTSFKTSFKTDSSKEGGIEIYKPVKQVEEEAQETI